MIVNPSKKWNQEAEKTQYDSRSKLFDKRRGDSNRVSANETRLGNCREALLVRPRLPASSALALLRMAFRPLSFIQVLYYTSELDSLTSYRNIITFKILLWPAE